MPKDEKVVADAVAPAADLSPVGDSVRISSEVVAAIASMASVDIPGIAGMSGGVVGGLAEKLGRRDLTKGIRVTVDEDRV
ncbi:MAG TPA: Asp23/Gls24 family envelope stress response protein, partial [Candidatus Limnocylindrales bacterium]|nr:Asp23/Gls24 family envelope stress response protein [Candidatus Limnocylindrales bacterium]